jgi:CheY-like chemotaxis protein/phosphoribosyl 1,2-cyclic phosphodiesterase
MRVRFWGTRGSIATPGPGTVRFGGNTSCFELQTANGDLLIFDCGSGIRLLGSELMAKAKKPIRGSILLTHTHWDHIQGFPFFAPLFSPGNQFAVYAPQGGDASLHEVLAGQMEFTYFPVELSQLSAEITYRDLSEGTHDIGGVRVIAQYLNHPAVTLGYRVEADGVAVVYLNDHEPFSDTLWRSDAEPGRLESILHEGDRHHARFMAGADLVIHDAQYTPEEYPGKKNWGHSTFEYVVDIAAAAGVRRVALTHHDPAHDDRAIGDIERRARAQADRRGSPLEVFSAYEGWDAILTHHGVPSADGSRVDALSAATPRSGARILVVDDDPDLRRLAMKALEVDRHAVSEATNGRDAVRMVGEVRPDLIVLDIDMPGMTGIEVLRVLRADPETADLPVLLLTAAADESTTRTGFDAGATDYLTKPFKIPQLSARVRACLARSARG